MVYSPKALVISMAKYELTPELLDSEEECELRAQGGVKAEKGQGGGTYIVIIYESCWSH